MAFVLKLLKGNLGSKWLTLKATTMSAAVSEYHEMLTKYGRGEALPKRQANELWQAVVNRFEKEHLQRLKPTTAASYKSALKLILDADAFKDRPIRILEYEDVQAFHRNLADRPRQANVCVQALQADL